MAFNFDLTLPDVTKLSESISTEDQEAIKTLDEIIFTIGRIKQRLARGPVVPQRPPKPGETPPSKSPTSPKSPSKLFIKKVAQGVSPDSEAKKREKKEKKKKQKNQTVKYRSVSFTPTQSTFLIQQLEHVRTFLEQNFEPDYREKVENVKLLDDVIQEIQMS